MSKLRFNTASLMVRENNGNYREATREDIFNAAMTELTKKFARGAAMENPDAVMELLKLRLAHYDYEVFGVLWLDNKHRVIEFEELFTGTINSATVHPREVVRSALEHNAAACVLCHNHPSGNAAPSQADKSITSKLKNVLELIDTRIIDHIIVAEDTYSFAQNFEL